ncbi:MAG TPA: hypothetical protein VF661_06955 [Actinomycetales bacterium]
MFTKSSRRSREQVADVHAVADTWGKVAPVVTAKTRDAVDWAVPHIERGREAAQPKVEAAVVMAVDKVTPAVDAALEKVTPAVDAAREKLDELVPRLVEALTAAAAAGAAAGATAGEYKSRSGDAVAVLRGEAVAKRKSGGGFFRKLALLSLVPAAVAAAYAAYQSRQPKEDPWAVPTGTYPAYTPPAPVDPTLSSGSAADALDGTAAVPGLSVDSEAAATTINVDGDGTTTSAEPYDPTSPDEQR